MPEEGSYVLHQAAGSYGRVLMSVTSAETQAVQSEEFLQQPCVRCPQQDKGPSVAHICPTTYIRGCRGLAR